MPHCDPATRISHRLANALAEGIVPSSSPASISQLFHEFQKENQEPRGKKVAHITFRGRVRGLNGKKLAIHFDMVQETVFLGMGDEIVDVGVRRSRRRGR